MAKLDQQTILVVDDDQDIRETVCMLLEDEGYRAVGAANGAEALAMLDNAEHPCLVLLDLMMPVMNGWEFIEQLEKRHALDEIPVVVQSAADEVLRPDGVRGYLKKPVHLDTLLARVRQYCRCNCAHAS